ncbi:low-density lipoprotein receptor-related protein 6 isoform X2 [Nematostella vectensis]|uniref:low-density lipoprotein receptor-related protein 6 isoform X2 n=1 Tax=Nematostella vectensis TaxID=45351 RepID=UPI0020773ED1|nr:low-density lipoprotein receptor-related protein 6 isoform X2 [Nematostella vectensis]
MVCDIGKGGLQVLLQLVLLLRSSRGETFIFFSNASNINKLEPNSTTITPVIFNLDSAVALDVDVRDRRIYWSDTRTKAIKRAQIDGTFIEDIITTNIGVCDGLAIEWRTRRIYWTDRTYRFIQVATLDGSRRHVLISSGLDKPRGIAVHPQAGLMFWTDWGENPKIERARLDGQKRQEIVTSNIGWPNSIAVDYAANRLFWVDAIRDSLESSDLDGRARRTLFRQPGLQPFGVSILGKHVYWSDWASEGIHMNRMGTGKLEKSVYNVGNMPMGVAVFDKSRQPPGNNTCSKQNGGCSYLCLPSATGTQCACPWESLLSSDNKSCAKASEIFMLVSDPEIPAIYKIYLDVPNHNRGVLSVNETTDITYDRFEDRIYWIDGAQRNIHRAYMNMTEHEQFGMYTVRPESLALDWLGRHLYWTDAGTKRIEAAQLDTGIQAPVIMAGLDKPRGLVLDPPNGHMFWTDWGSKPKIEKSNMDGTSRWTLLDKDLIWPNALTIDYQSKRLFWADAKLNRIEVCDWYGENRKPVFEKRGMHPFGMAFFGDKLYWTDYKTKSVQELSLSSGVSKPFVRRLSFPRGLYVYDPSTYKTAVSSLCQYAGCSHLCFIRHGGYTCTCPSGYRLGRNRKTCIRANEFLLFIDAIAVSLNILPLDDTNIWTPVSVLPGKAVQPADLDYDPVEDAIFWTDTFTGTINSYNMQTRKSMTLHRCNVERPDGIGVDWIGRNLYWTDSGKGRIEVSRLDGTARKVLIQDDLERPTALVLFPEEGTMFFSDCGSRPKMEKAYMDGTSRITFVDRKITCPTSLNIDRQSERIYWLDDNRDGIWSVFFNGANREVTYFERGTFPWGITLSGLITFVSDWKRGNIYKLSIETNVELNITVAEEIKKPTAIRYYNQSRYNFVESQCSLNNGGCSDLCLLRPHSRTCACATGVPLSPDEKTCDHAVFNGQSNERYLLISDLQYRDVFKVPLHISDFPCLSLYNNPRTDLPEQSPVAASVVYNPRDRLIYWTDERRGAVMRASLDDSFREVIADKGIISPDGIDVDYISRNVYWTDPKRGRIEVASLDGKDRLTLTGWSPDKPGAIVLDPVEGRMYWADYGTNPKIMTAHMDGSNRKILMGVGINITTGLAIDFRFRRLYWCDMGTGKIESMSLNGGNRISVYDLNAGRKFRARPFGLAFSKGKLYWADMMAGTVYELEVATGTTRVVASGLFSPTDVRVVDQRELFDVTNKCGHLKGGCSNLCLPRLAPPGRRCACSKGVKLKRDDPTTCEGVYRCSKPPRTRHRKVDPLCNNLPGTRCTFSCEPGYAMQGQATLHCYNNGSWSASFPTCKVITCLPPIPPRYGYMDPPECNFGAGVSYGVTCYYVCNITAGFMKEGPESTFCQSNGMWTMDTVPPSCRDTKPPIIVCPENIYTQTDPGKPTAKVTWPTPVPQDNADRKPRLRVEPKGMRSPHEFPAGDTMITYTSEDESGLTSSCSFLVTIDDREAPRVKSCPHNYTVMTETQPSVLNFPGISFEDNVGIERIDFINGTQLEWGDHDVTVRAHDKAGNTADCMFKTMVYSKSCAIDSPLNGFKHCRFWRDGGIYCFIGCNSGYGFSTVVEKMYMCSVSDHWIHARMSVDGLAHFPDCSRVSKVKEVSIKGVLYYKSSMCLRPHQQRSVQRHFSKLLNAHVLSRLECCTTNGTCKVGKIQPACYDDKESRRRRRAVNPSPRLRVRFMIKVFLKTEASFSVMNRTRHNILNMLRRGINVSVFHMMIGKNKTSVDVDKGFNVLVEGICGSGQVYNDGKCVNCPIGYFHNATECSCTLCPPNTYQDQEQQSKCHMCPAGLSTFGLQGATSKDQCRECKDYEPEDKYGDCTTWRQQMKCVKDRPMMFKYCPKTCGICRTWQKRAEVLSNKKANSVNLKAVIPALVIPTIIVICIAVAVIILLRKRKKSRLNMDNCHDKPSPSKKKVRIQQPNSNKYNCIPVKQLQVRLEKRRKSKKAREKDKSTKNYNGVVCVSSPMLRHSNSVEKKLANDSIVREEDEIYVRIPLQRFRVRLDDRKKRDEDKAKDEDEIEQERVSNTTLELQALNAQMDATQV